MKNAVVATLLLSLTAVSAQAVVCSVRFDPPAADDRHSVDAIVFGIEPTSCNPGDPHVVRNGASIEVHLTPLGQVCLSAPAFWRLAVPLGVLDAGVYDVSATIDETKPSPVVHAPLIVRAVGSFRVTPFAIPIGGGRVTIDGYLPGGELYGVTFDDRFVSVGYASRSAVAPPHAAGTIDVTLQVYDPTTGASHVAAKAALTYFDPAAEPDPALFEPILFPVAYSGAGGFSSWWVTENLISDPYVVYRTPPPSLDGNSTTGILLWAVRNTTDGLTAQSRFGEVARGGGLTAVPVVREGAFRRMAVPTQIAASFLKVPMPPNSRATLRVWSLGDPGTVHGPVPLHPVRKSVGEPYFAMAEVTYALQDRQDVFLSTDFDAPLWAMLSITDNDTQRVTIVTSQ